MITWWNGRHAGLKIPSSFEGVGSSPIVVNIGIAQRLECELEKLEMTVQFCLPLKLDLLFALW
jgi:hypothetical protein